MSQSHSFTKPRLTRAYCQCCQREFESIDALIEHDCWGDELEDYARAEGLPLVTDGGEEVVDRKTVVLDDFGHPVRIYSCREWAAAAVASEAHADRECVEYLPEIPEYEPTGSEPDCGEGVVTDGGFQHEESQFERRISTRGGLEDLRTDIDVAMHNMWVEIRERQEETGEYRPVTVEATLSITGGGYATDGGEAVDVEGAFVSGHSAIHEYAPDPPELDPESMCTECGEAAHNYRCGSCARPLCHKHHELGAGFCSDFTRDEDNVPGCEISGEFYRAAHLLEDGEKIDRGDGVATDGGDGDD